MQETQETQRTTGWRQLSKREKLGHVCSAVAASVILIGGVAVLPEHPSDQPAQLSLAQAGWELRGRAADGHQWRCTAEAVGENIWITAAHCVDDAVGDLVLIKGDDVRQVSEYKTAAKHTRSDHNEVRYDVAVVGDSSNMSVELQDFAQVQPGVRLQVRSIQSDGLWHECIVARSDAYYDGGHWHVPCNLGHGASGSGVWANGALVGVLSSISSDGENSLADPRDLIESPY